MTEKAELTEKTGEDKEEHGETMLRNAAVVKALGELNHILRIGIVGRVMVANLLIEDGT